MRTATLKALCALILCLSMPVAAEPAAEMVTETEVTVDANSPNASSLDANTLDAPADELPLRLREAQDGLSEILRQWHADEEEIGERRRQRLTVARYYLRTEDFGRSLADDPNAMEETTSIVRSIVGKLARHELEKRLDFDRLEKKFDRPDPEPGHFRLRVSPRINLGGDNASLGARFSLNDGENGLWSRFALGYTERMERDERSIYLQYRGEDTFVSLEHVDGVGGEEIGLSVRWKFR